MAIYDYNTDIIGEQLTPPILRQPKFLAWVKTILKPIQWLWSLVFEDYANGSVYNEYDNSATYQKGDRVIFTNNKVYECIVSGGISGINCLDTDNWLVINDNYIGARERIKYNGQIILLEYALNKWFRNLAATDQIYITTNSISTNVFVMGETGEYSSKLANDSTFSFTYLANSPNFTTQYNMTINVPSALYTTLGSNATNREMAVRNVADKYVLSGIKYEVTTY